jgi:hypothetical protein
VEPVLGVRCAVATLLPGRRQIGIVHRVAIGGSPPTR